MKPVFRRTRRVLPLLLVATLGLGLASCGDDEPSSSSSSNDNLDSVSVEGEVGTEPKVTFDGKVDVSEITTEVLTEGDGPELATGDQVLSHLWIGNGFTEEKAFSTYDAEKPELLTVDEQQLSPLFIEAVDGQTVGSRVMVAAPASEAFGEQGNPELGIGNKDTVVVVVDLMSDVLEEPSGQSAKPPSWVPDLVEKDGVPTGFDFKGVPEPNGQLRSADLVKGDGAKVEKGQTIVVNYLGQVFGGKQPFDESFSGDPTSFQIGVGAVVPGWDKTLVGTNVGSRVVLAIPPEDGYGKQGNPQAGIKGDDTLYFVVDVLAAG
ncbi:FKBP-type peptidyl-prolyl cis-trans isomerase [Nocardioides sp.]|uniref:FKBP-type peptidyl-prolyl cis-trans isomerase n=1 Tax=Nocardioides sp. TaxID=35761 RepID=UPI002D806498|nr:FKBP-type peptidyl-prolyl cis-trans isomerase [Nocardioides sp.]